MFVIQKEKQKFIALGCLAVIQVFFIIVWGLFISKGSDVTPKEVIKEVPKEVVVSKIEYKEPYNNEVVKKLIDTDDRIIGSCSSVVKGLTLSIEASLKGDVATIQKNTSLINDENEKLVKLTNDRQSIINELEKAGKE